MSVFRVGSNKSSVNNFPSVRPTLDLDFANSKTLDSRITFTRASGGSYVGADGLIKYAGVNEARFDHDPVTGESLGLLVEEARTNLVTYSEDFTTWTKQAISGGVVGIIPNNLTSPDGTINATRYYVQTAGSSFYSLLTGVSVSASTSYTYSVFIKPGESTTTNLHIFDGVDNASSSFNLNTGALTATFPNANTTIQSTGSVNYGNGWYRYFMTFSSILSGGFSVKIDLGTTTLNRGFYIWGAQLEQGSFPTSYIPTVASTRTRAADNASITGKNFSEWYRQDEGTMFAGWSYPVTPSSFPRIWQFTEGAAGAENSFVISTNLFNHNRFSARAQNVGLFDSQQGPDATVNQSMRSAMALKAGQHAYSGNGTAPATNTVAMPSGIDRCWIGSVNGGLFLTGHIRRLTYYPKRLPNAQLQALTK